MSDPAGNFDPAALAAFNYYPNARRPRIAQGTAVHVGYEIRHACVVSAANISKITLRVKRFAWFRPSLNFGFFHYPVEGGVEKGEESFCDELKAYTSVNWGSPTCDRKNRELHQKAALTFIGHTFK